MSSSLRNIPNFLNNKKKQVKRRSLMAEYFEYSTVHGLPEVYRADRTSIKILWAVIFFAALGAAIFGIYAILADYITSPVVVSYMVKEAPDGMILPDLVICPFNRFNKTFFKEHNVSYEVTQYLELSYPMPWTLEFQNHTIIQLPTDENYLKFVVDEMLERVNMTYEKFIQKATLDCSSLFIKPVNCERFETVMTSVGKCFRVTPEHRQSAPGFGFGLQVIISLPREHYSPGANQMPNDGIVLKLAEAGKGIDMDLTFIPKGVHAILPLKATKYEFINDPPRYECLESVQPEYSRVSCFDTCKTRLAEDKCNCSTLGSNSARLVPCTPAQSLGCFYPEMHKTLQNVTVARDCRRRCQPACSYWKYQPTISYTQFPSPETREFVKDDAEWEKLHEYIILEAFFEHLEFTLIKHFPSMTGNSFIAQLGGQVSLWVGGSILTLVQLLIFLLQMTCPTHASRSRDPSRRVKRSQAALFNQESVSIDFSLDDVAASQNSKKKFSSNKLAVPKARDGHYSVGFADLRPPHQTLMPNREDKYDRKRHGEALV